MSARLVLCACPDAATAAALGRALVDARLAACATVLPGATSIYRWEGRIEEAQEAVLLIKTWADRVEALAERIRAEHPYELPEVVAVEAAGGLAGYLAWIHAETRTTDTPAA
ncbi:divalent-cation tolerance protein CutA [Coralloluteibacterium thermophilus]|uniref:Divalent-cation tolerance protein CutA n=1 Tax=Coralloluteibacterium thermophilum TaxID=2707049 RepID=A0ABV9NG29_9GAMM